MAARREPCPVKLIGMELIAKGLNDGFSHELEHVQMFVITRIAGLLYSTLILALFDMWEGALSVPKAFLFSGGGKSSRYCSDKFVTPPMLEGCMCIWHML